MLEIDSANEKIKLGKKSEKENKKKSEKRMGALIAKKGGEALSPGARSSWLFLHDRLLERLQPLEALNAFELAQLGDEMDTEPEEKVEQEKASYQYQLDHLLILYLRITRLFNSLCQMEPEIKRIVIYVREAYGGHVTRHAEAEEEVEQEEDKLLFGSDSKRYVAMILAYWLRQADSSLTLSHRFPSDVRNLLIAFHPTVLDDPDLSAVMAILPALLAVFAVIELRAQLVRWIGEQMCVLSAWLNPLKFAEAELAAVSSSSSDEDGSAAGGGGGGGGKLKTLKRTISMVIKVPSTGLAASSADPDPHEGATHTQYSHIHIFCLALSCLV